MNKESLIVWEESEPHVKDGYKYIVGIDPFKRVTWWMKLLSFLGLYTIGKSKGSRYNLTMMRVNTDNNVCEMIKNYRHDS